MFAVLAFPFAAGLVFEDERWIMASLYLGSGLLSIVAVRTWQDNRNPWKWGLAIVTKVSLAVLFVVVGIAALAPNRTESDNKEDSPPQSSLGNAMMRIVGFGIFIGLGAFIYRLMRDKPSGFWGR